MSEDKYDLFIQAVAELEPESSMIFGNIGIAFMEPDIARGNERKSSGFAVGRYTKPKDHTEDRWVQLMQGNMDNKWRARLEQFDGEPEVPENIARFNGILWQFHLHCSEIRKERMEKELTKLRDKVKKNDENASE